jgi:uncharacterized protein with HEPN domain
MTLEQFIADERTYDAVIRNLEIIGEATKNIPDDIRTNYPDIEWRKIAGLRDILAHAYFSLENEIIWDIVQNKVFPLLEGIQHILEVEFGKG